MSTADGVKAIDVAWLAANRPEIAEDPQVLTCAPEICVEIFSPSNSLSEINEKRTLYFDAGAAEVWVCAVDGSISFFVSPHHQSPASSHLPGLPWPHPVISRPGYKTFQCALVVRVFGLTREISAT